MSRMIHGSSLPIEVVHLKQLSRRAGLARGRPASSVIAILLAVVVLRPGLSRASDPVGEQFEEQIQPILEDSCYACHGNGIKKGGVALDAVSTDGAGLHDRDLWWKVLRNVRAGLMPPAGQPRP